MTDALMGQLDRMRRGALIVAAAGLLVLIIAAVIRVDVMFQSYLVGVLYWLGVSLGCAALAMIYHLTGGGWGRAIVPVLESGVRTLGVMAVLFVPVLLGAGWVYDWLAAPGAAGATDPEGPGDKAIYLNLPFFIGRTVIYFGLWLVGGLCLVQWAVRYRATGDALFSERLARLSAGGLVAYVLTVTFSSIDWIMTIDAHWYSSIFGLLIAIGQIVAALSLAIVAVIVASRAQVASLPVRTLHDLGTMLLAAVTFWAYITFSQFLIIWYGNLPEEVTWYVRRMQGAWFWVAIALIVLHFAVPMAVLLSRQSKREPTIMLTIAGSLLVMHAADLIWIVAPSFNREAWWPVIVDVAAVGAVGGVWLYFFSGYIRQAGAAWPAPPGETVAQHG